MAQYGFFFDGTRCTGCKTCVLACVDYHDLTADLAYRHVYEITGGETTRDEAGCVSTTCFSYTVSSSCQHCLSPACTAACPTGAMSKDDETGLVSVNAKVCIGCGACATVCPYNAPKVDAKIGHSVKCNGCAERLAAHLAPVCVLACPARALAFAPVEQLYPLGEVADIAPFGDSSITRPNLYIKPSADACKCTHDNGLVANPLEV